MTILKDKEERKKEIQVVKRIARANGYQRDEVDRVIGKMSTRKGKQNTTVPYVGKHTDKVIKAFSTLTENTIVSDIYN